MKKASLILTLLIFSITLFAQQERLWKLGYYSPDGESELMDFKQYGNKILLFKLSADEAEKILNNWEKSLIHFINQKADYTIHSDSFYTKNADLPYGNYLSAKLQKGRIIISYYVKSPYKIFSWELDKKHFGIIVLDSMHIQQKFDKITNKKGKEIKINNSLRAVSIPKKAYRYYLIRVRDYVLFYRTQSTFNRGNGYYSNRKNKGFIALDKPKYKPGDTLHFKAFVYDKKERAYDKTLEFQIIEDYNYSGLSRYKKDISLEPISPGAYVGSLILDDSLRIDKSYTISVYGPKKIYIENNFRLEDYRLDNYRLEVDLNRKTIYKNENLQLNISAMDFKNERIRGGRYKITIKSGDFFPKENESFFAPNKLYEKEGNISAQTPTVIQIKEDVFPHVTGNVDLVVNVWNSSNEQKSYSRNISIKAQPRLELIPVKDSVRYTLHNQKSIPIKVIWENHVSILKHNKGAIALDYTQKIPSFSYEYDGQLHQVYITGYPKPFFFAERIKDSIYLRIKNPFEIPLRLRAFDKNKPLFFSTNLSLDSCFYYPQDKDITFIFEYHLNGKYTNDKYEMRGKQDNYQIEVELPEIVEPSSTHKLKIKVNDQKGNPVTNVNLTTWAYNGEFNYSNNVPDFGTYPTFIQKNSSEYYLQSYSKTMYGNYLPDYQKRFGISDTNLYYKLRSIQQGTLQTYLPAAGYIAQFAPYIISYGHLNSIYYIMIDANPVFYHYAYEGPWSFPYVSGHHQVAIRTKDKLYVIDSVEFKAGKKLELAIHAERPGDGVQVLDMKKKLNKAERRMIENHLVDLNGNRWDNSYYLQGFRTYKANGHYHLPFESAQFSLLSDNHIQKGYLNYYENQIIHRKNGFVYKKKDIKVKKRQNRNPYKPYSYQPRYDNFNVGSYLRKIEPIQQNRLTLPPDIPFIKQAVNNCKLNLYNHPDSMEIGEIYMVSMDKKDYFYQQLSYNNQLYSYYQRNSNRYSLPEGEYQLICYTKNNNLLIYHVSLKKEGTNYFNFDHEKASYIPLDSYKKSEQDSIIHHLFLKDRIEVYEEKNYWAYRFFHRPKSYDSTNFIVCCTNEHMQNLPNSFLFAYQTNQSLTIPNYYKFYRVTNTSTDSLLVFKNGLYKNQRITNKSIPEKYDFILIPSSKNSDFYNQLSDNNLFENNIRIINNATELREVEVAFKNTNGVRFSLSQKPRKKLEAIACPSFGGTYKRGRGDYAGDALYEWSDARSDGFIGLNYTSALSLEDEMLVAIEAADKNIGGLPAMYGDFYSLDSAIIPGHPAQIRKDFSDVGFWVPNLITNEKGEAEAEITFPDNITGWKMVVLAAGQRGEQGRYEQDIKAMKQVAASLSVPRFLIQGDTSAVYAKIVNYGDSRRMLEDYFKLGDKIKYALQFPLDSFSNQEFRVYGQDSLVYAEYGFTGSEGESDAEGRNIPVLPKGSHYAEGQFHQLEGDSTFSITAGNKTMSVVFYPSLLDVLLEDIEEVKNYPYDCNEQLASKLMVLLMQEKIYQQLNQKFKHKKDIKRLITRLENSKKEHFQWGWWTDSEYLPWVSNHVLSALALAQIQGYKISSMMEKEVNFMYYNRNENPNLRYLWAAMGKITNPTNLDFNPLNLSIEDQLWNYKTKQILKVPFTVDEIVNLSKKSMDGGRYWGTNAHARDENQILCTSLAYEIIYAVDSLHPILDEIELFLLNRHGFQKLNTYEMAYMVNALLPRYLYQQGDFKSAEVRENGHKLQFNQPIQIPAGQSRSFTITSGAKIYAASWKEYFNPNPQQVDSLFAVESWFTDKDQKRITELKEGDQLDLWIKIKAKRQAEYVMVEIPLPAGTFYLERNDQRHPLEVHREYYKDKLIIYFKQLPANDISLSLRLQAVFNGSFTLNPVSVKEMYYPFFYGRNGIKKIRILIQE